MRKLSRFGAAALAMALSLTMVAPISANAEVIDTWEKDAQGQEVHTYTNEDTKASISEKDGYEIHNSDALATDAKIKYVTVKSENETWELSTTKDVAKFTNFKSNKKALKVKVIQKDEASDTNNPKTSIIPDYKDKDGNAYYKNVNGEIVKVEKAKLDTDLPKGQESGTYILKLYAKKAGTYKLSYDAVLKNGTTVKKTIKVTARDDGDAIKSITYAGKVVYTSTNTDAAPTNYLWTKGYGVNTTNKAKGKIKVTANKDIKIKKIEVGTPKLKTTDYPESDYSYTSYEPATSDLDYGTGMEYGATVAWKTVKNGKTIKLSKVDTAAAYEYSYKGHEYVRKSTSTTSYIRVTYYDKKNKTTNRVYFTINLVKK